MTETFRCPCGSDLFVESTKCSGWWKSIVDGTGKVVDTDLDGVKYGDTPKTVKCWECGKTHPNPRLKEMAQ